jgi:hypothetical protein
MITVTESLRANLVKQAAYAGLLPIESFRNSTPNGRRSDYRTFANPTSSGPCSSGIKQGAGCNRRAVARNSLGAKSRGNVSEGLTEMA